MSDLSIDCDGGAMLSLDEVVAVATAIEAVMTVPTVMMKHVAVSVDS